MDGMIRTYAIGDIHGALDKLLAAHALIAADAEVHGPAPVVHLGDLVDRGPDSRGVIEFLIDGLAGGRDWVVLKGNHDRMFAGFLTAPDWQDPGLRGDLSWLHPRLGGAATLQSYGVKSPGDRRVRAVQADAAGLVPAAHRAFLEGLPAFLQRGPAAFVHAGLRPGIAFDLQLEDDLVWIREPFLSDDRDHGALVVHGHTVVDRAEHRGNRVNIDTGAGYGGPLTVIAVEDRRVFALTPRGRVELQPGG
jgi:serine/threonine protein phosphatase 1